MATVTTLAATNIVGESDEQLVTMIVDNQLFGIPILQVQDIVEASKITPVPLAPSAIAGVLNLRGRIVTVIDLRKLMGNHEEVPWESQMGVTVEFKGDLYTLLVDAIGDVRTLAKRDYDKTPSTMEPEVKRLCSGIYRLRGNLLVVLDVGRILKSDVIAATPMLTVEERKKRKAASKQEAGNDDGRTRQLSALMNDLRAYEAENAELQNYSGVNDASDDIKARKRANRSRRPVADRWKEVLDQRDRQQGKVVYRMREPDEETLEEARDKEHEPESVEPIDESDSVWQSRVRSGEDDGSSAAGPQGRDDIVDLSDRRASAGDELTDLSDGTESSDETVDPGDAEAGEGSGVFSGWWNKLRGKDEDEAPAAETADSEPAAETAEDEAATLDEPAADASPPADEIVAVDDFAEDDVADADDKPTSGKAADKPAKSGKTAKSAKSSGKAKSAPKGKKK